LGRNRRKKKESPFGATLAGGSGATGQTFLDEKQVKVCPTKRRGDRKEKRGVVKKRRNDWDIPWCNDSREKKVVPDEKPQVSSATKLVSEEKDGKGGERLYYYRREHGKARERGEGRAPYGKNGRWPGGISQFHRSKIGERTRIAQKGSRKSGGIEEQDVGDEGRVGQWKVLWTETKSEIVKTNGCRQVLLRNKTKRDGEEDLKRNGYHRRRSSKALTGKNQKNWK